MWFWNFERTAQIDLWSKVMSLACSLLRAVDCGRKEALEYLAAHGTMNGVVY
jgi:hypothetical protein